MVDKVIPQEITNAVINNLRKKKKTNHLQQKLPTKFKEFTTPTPFFSKTEAQKQTIAKTDQNFEAVFSKIIGKKH